jgi:hypothetical protein
MQHLDLDDEQAAALIALLKRAIAEDDPYRYRRASRPYE